jgi:hypothetical protein
MKIERGGSNRTHKSIFQNPVKLHSAPRNPEVEVTRVKGMAHSASHSAPRNPRVLEGRNGWIGGGSVGTLWAPRVLQGQAAKEGASPPRG